jgi:hypothetical protein
VAKFKDQRFYKSKWVSDVELGYGGKEAVRFHSNSFKFLKKGNLAIILITIPLVTCLFQGRPNESCW